MKVKSIISLSDPNDRYTFDSNIYVSVDLEDGYNYVVVVGTQKNLLTLMNNEKSDFLSPGDPIIVVRKLTKEVIEETIRA